MRSLVEQLRDAFEAKEWSVAKLLESSGLTIDRTSLAKKLKGDIRLNTDEAQAIARALEVTLVWVPAEAERDEKAEGAA